MLRLSISRMAARRLYSIATYGLNRELVGGIPVHYQHEAFRAFLGDAVSLLQENDRLDFDRMKNALTGVVELDGSPAWSDKNGTNAAGFPIGVFFDEFTQSQREAIGLKRYAARLAGFGIRRQITSRVARIPGWRFDQVHSQRILTIARRRELRCCRLIGCDAKHIYNMERLLRNN